MSNVALLSFWLSMHLLETDSFVRILLRFSLSLFLYRASSPIRRIFFHLSFCNMQNKITKYSLVWLLVEAAGENMHRESHLEESETVYLVLLLPCMIQFTINVSFSSILFFIFAMLLYLTFNNIFLSFTASCFPALLLTNIQLFVF